MSRSLSNLPSDADPSSALDDADTPPRFSDQFLLPPILTSDAVGWNSISLECYNLPPAETPNLCFSHYTISINLGQSVAVDLQIDGVAKGQIQRKTLVYGCISMVPMQHHHWAAWHQLVEGFAMSLKPELLIQNAAELLDIDQIELLPQAPLSDSFILQIGLALKADLESHRPGGRLYAETMATTLAVYLLRNYSAHSHRSFPRLGGLSQSTLKQVTDYINDHLEQELGLKELAAVVQLSPYHFCRSFKQSTGFTPHQYVIRQRVEQAKRLLKIGEMGILEVALACGFAHQSHFHHHFKRLTGVTPKKFSQQ